MAAARILVVGGASLDRLDGREEIVAGGAGMYTAMAAHRSGAAVTLFAPRPEPMPDALRAVATNLRWLGPSIAADDLARFEINHRNGRTTYVNAFFGAEGSLSPSGLPDDLSGFDCVHLVPLGDIGRQRAFLRACRERGARCISAGTALTLIDKQPEDALAVLQAADIFFMNEAEAIRLFGSLAAVRSRPGQLLFVTRGQRGATVVKGDALTDLAGVAVEMLDPTGAGDTFCGAALVGVAAGLHPVMAARHAMPLAAEMTTAIGPTALLDNSPAPAAAMDERVVVNVEQLGRIATLIAGLPEITPFAFTGPDLPARDHPAAHDYFFATSLQQFGFWSATDSHYDRPLVATIDGEQRKGAFYLFRAWMRWLRDDPERLAPAAQANLTDKQLRAVLLADDGSEPMPELDTHLALARAYGRDMLALGLTPQIALQKINAAEAPVAALLQLLDHIGGYKEDPLRKKSALLAVILLQRPEAWLAGGAADVPPIVDYHVMRSCLRMGLIEVREHTLRERLVRRALLPESDEWAVRYAAFRAMQQLVTLSGKSMGAVDWFFFQARERCPEMTPPDCAHCAVDAVCAHRRDLFQPVRRTSFY
ncbi:MAG: carbohydrate kinase family protein [Gammaproteobacteria bacterium]|nr:carbohydrate kinase family protein [Gammaproteobacteria bacterium]